MSIGQMVFDQKTYNQQLMFVEGEKINCLQSFGNTPLPLKYLILVVNTINLFTEVNCVCIGKAFCITALNIYSTVTEFYERHDTKHYDTHHNDIQPNNKESVTLVIMTRNIMAEHCYAECLLCW